MEGFGADRYLVDQLDRSTANLYRITPLAEGDTPAGPPVAYVRQEKLEITEDIRFYADEAETEEVFQIKACNILDLGGSRYDVYAGEKQIGALEHRASRMRTTWRVRDASNQEIASRTRAQPRDGRRSAAGPPDRRTTSICTSTARRSAR